MNPQQPNTQLQPMQQPQQNSQQGSQVDPTQQANQAKANLGFVNTMQEHLLQHHASKNAQQAPASPQEAPGQEQTTKPTNDLKETETRLMTEIQGIKDSLEKLAPKDENKELEDLKKKIEDVLNSEETNENE